MNPTPTIAALLAGILVFPLAAAAQDDEAIDDIVVVGEKSSATLRNEVFEAEEDFYSVYNRFNDDKDFAVRCFYETPTGTRIRNHVCRAKFVTDAYSKQASRGRADVTRIANQDADSEFAVKSERFQQNLETLIASHPELQAALLRYNEARARFDAKSEADNKR